MKICVTAKGSDLDASVDPHFGRCNNFLVVDSETMEFQSIGNDQGSASGGAGVQAAQQVIGKGINVLITGSVGPNAFSLLESENIEMKMVSGGSVQEAIEAYRSGSLESINTPNSAGKSGK
ncbi:Predicted Fe-Mo cluster-binding protein, NifX family [Methanolobus vulcani]|jgi:predicted Fe-Mo cluster-binding NifX family protein|uniref:Predicted Fe-Mo cluster-binding protein, NifX family n=1 Tax=Methanolobus vulcani TaxID=38026 RepID=A0A7Z7FC56_9EURY|nr:NifB/NifX family molybdenum-iron cluster-binding protein [Methanolobus vulcani]SDF54607.1 Predicted Fe-Mo cluster-binding protein, NifX family [Methanolobus vulcani]